MQLLQQQNIPPNPIQGGLFTPPDMEQDDIDSTPALDNRL